MNIQQFICLLVWWFLVYQFSSFAQLCLTLCEPHEPQHSRPPYPSPIARVYPNPCLLSWYCHPTISSSVIPFSFCLQSFQISKFAGILSAALSQHHLSASGSFPVSQFFTSGGQSTGVSVSTSVLPMSIQGWFPFGLTGLISLQSKGLSRVFSNTTVWKHQFFSAQLSS